MMHPDTPDGVAIIEAIRRAKEEQNVILRQIAASLDAIDRTLSGA